ncbi:MULTISPECIES: hypothetical protein [Nostoc]|jgi:hypothetical protein|uniref:Uncharacterized protein n=1 Tax=Nostoc punctiforme FACHB-252 TaxID=1357509 RepID=A0ABR8HF99_NOSPU|nr:MULTISPECIES: hypothetical protein [Nostoc]MBC1237811.1 hypothetical protein [Nostoc sp. 2RC]MBD2614475.1 hypothetical protein [Nostoc punctiforme FACHB-252]MDZ8011813.1 hypothetical protein [Nostoc sp. ZfuVER08]
MSLIDGLLLTLLNTVACLALPKLLSVILSAKNQKTTLSPVTVNSQDSNSEIPSYS